MVHRLGAGYDPKDTDLRESVSVVIPLHNRRHLIPFTLASLEQRHHPGIAIQTIVVDDGSTDGGPELVTEDFPSVTLVCQARMGASAARNRGIALASAPGLLLLDSDDLVEPGFFRTRLNALALNENAAGAYGPWQVFESDGEFAPQDVRPRYSEYPIENRVEAESHLTRLLRGWYIVSSAVLWRSSVVRQLGGYNATLKINQDVEFMFRVLLSTPGIVGISGPCALIRDHSGPRQGQVSTDDGRVLQILDLRRQFLRALNESRRLTDSNRHALAEYAFDCWASWRAISPTAANDLLALSQQLWPGLPLRGGRLIRTLGALLGPAKATIVKQRLQAWYGKRRGTIAPLRSLM